MDQYLLTQTCEKLKGEGEVEGEGEGIRGGGGSLHIGPGEEGGEAPWQVSCLAFMARLSIWI